MTEKITLVDVLIESVADRLVYMAEDLGERKFIIADNKEVSDDDFDRFARLTDYIGDVAIEVNEVYARKNK